MALSKEIQEKLDLIKPLYVRNPEYKYVASL